MVKNPAAVKALLRAAMQPIVAGIDWPAVSRILEEVLLSRWGYATLTIGAFWPLKGEFDLRGFMKAYTQKGGCIALPVAVPGKVLCFREWTPASTLIKGLHGTTIPQEGEALIPDVILVPGLAFDPYHYRLGRGGGFYDRTIDFYRKNYPQTQVLGVFHTRQQVDALPREAWDQPLDDIIVVG